MSWDDEQAYSYTKNHNIKDWGWEFVRRNPEYKSEWVAALSKFKKTPGKNLEIAFTGPELSQYTGITLPACSIKDEKADSFVILDDVAMKWGVCGYYNPTKNKLNSESFTSVQMVYVGARSVEFEDQEDDIKVARDNHTLISVLDLKKPIKPQVDYLAERAKKFQKLDEGKIRKATNLGLGDAELWKTYIRCWDAQVSGVERKHAAPLLVTPTAEYQFYEEKWDETFKQAKNMVLSGYRSLIF